MSHNKLINMPTIDATGTIFDFAPDLLQGWVMPVRPIMIAEMDIEEITITSTPLAEVIDLAEWKARRNK